MFDFSLICTDSNPNLLGIFDTTIAPALLFYAYIPIALLSLVAGLIFFFNSQNKPLKNSFLGISFFFSLFIFNETLQWVLVPVSLMYFTWSLSLVLQAFIGYFSFKFVWLSIYNNSKIPDLLGLALIFPILLFLPTTLNLVSFDATLCEAEIGILWDYLHLFTILYLLFLTIWLVKICFTKRTRNVLHIYLIATTLIFSAIFYVANIFGDVTNVHEVNLIGPIGMLLFIVSCGYMNVRFRIFKFKTVQAQMLVIFLLFLLGSQFFLVNDFLSKALIAITFAISVIASSYLVQSVRREVQQREEIEKLAADLEKANVRLRELDRQKSEFVSIASHQLRSPLAAIRGYASMVLEGSFGKVDAKMAEPLNRIADSAKMMNESVEDFLSVSRIEGGNMKYELADFNLRDLAEHITDDLRPEGFKKGLLLLFKTDLTSQGLVHADKGKTQQILHNLINNSLKYTPKGTITIYVHDDIRSKKVIVDIIDTGIGMTPDTIHSLFEKFTRAKNANTVNIKGTGLGLFVAREMARAMGGDVVAHSDGEGHGSRFEFFLPVIL